MMGEVIGITRAQEPLKKLGCSRDKDNANSLAFYFNRPPTDAEMRFIDDVMARTACLVQSAVSTTEGTGR